MFNILQSDRLKKCTITFIVITILFSIFPIQTEAFSPQVIQRGATGDDVIELQSRLQYVGYYKGKIDGVFGWGTYWAVRNYQNDYGLGIDGLVGTEMKRKLEKTTEYDKAYVYGKIEQGKKFDTYGKTGRGPQPDWPPPGQRDSGNRQSPKKDQQPQGQAPGTGFQGYAKQQGTPGAGGAGTPPPGTPEPGGAGSPPAGTPEGAGAGTPPPGTPEPGGEGSPPAGTPEGGGAGTPPPGTPEGGGAGTPPAGTPEGQESPPPATPEVEQEAPAEPARAQQGVNIPDGFTANDLKLMANAVYGEARGEPYEGQVAVAAVILNRVKSPTFPNNVSGVIFEPLAFTAVADGQIWLEPNETARRAVVDAINGWDPTGGLVYYFNPDTATSRWMHARERVKRIGKHVFLR